MGSKTYKFNSAKNVKKAEARRFGGDKWPLYQAVSEQFNKPGGIQVPLSDWTERREQVNQRRTKKLPEATLKNFRNNLNTQLEKLRGQRDFKVSFSADGEFLIVEPKE